MFSPMFAQSPLPVELQQLLQLFSSLPEVRFPELEPQELQQAVSRLKERHLDLQQLEAQVEAARAALDEEHEALLRRGHRLFAYLKVFAESDEVLMIKVEQIALPRLKKSSVPKVEGEVGLAAQPKRRGRPRKVPATDALFEHIAGDVPEATASIS